MAILSLIFLLVSFATAISFVFNSDKRIFASLQCEARFKGFGAPPPPKQGKSEEELANSRSAQKRKYQELKKKAMKSNNIHRLVDGERDEKQQSQKSQGW